MPQDVYFRPRRLGHANLWVEDLERSQAFYHRVCGLTVEFWEPDLVATFLGTGQTPHDLGMIQTTGGKARYGRNGLLQIPEGVGVDVGLGHLAWELENEVELVEGYRKAKAAGVALDLTVDHQVAHSVYLFDPDGNYMEYYCDTVEDWRSVLQGEMELITSAWDPEAEPAPFSRGRYDTSPELRIVEDAPIHPVRVTHAVVESEDLERLVDFYTSVGGLESVKRDDGIVYLKGSVPGYPYHLVLCHGGKGYHHVAFELESEGAMDKAESELNRRGVSPVRRVEDARKRSFFLRDPDGLLSEYYVRRSDGFLEAGAVPEEERAFRV